MSSKSNASPALGQFVPGFDFLQSLAAQTIKGASGALPSMPALPNPANWVAPTLNVEELEKRISELKTVQFWLDQNAKALQATITALEVQKMTLATLKSMNFNMGEVANALKQKASDTFAHAASAAQAARGKALKSAATTTPPPPTDGVATPPAIDPMQWWGSLTQQFGQIAAQAMQGSAKKAAEKNPVAKKAGAKKSAVAVKKSPKKRR